VSAELTAKPAPRIAGRTVADVVDAWLEAGSPVCAESTRRDARSRAALVKGDVTARMQAGKLGVADVERWHARLRRAGVGESSIHNQHRILRSALAQAVRWGWLTVHPASLAELRPQAPAPRHHVGRGGPVGAGGGGFDRAPCRAGLAHRGGDGGTTLRDRWGSYLVVGDEDADPAVAEVVSVDAMGIVLVRVLPGPAEQHLHLVRHRQPSAS